MFINSQRNPFAIQVISIFEGNAEGIASPMLTLLTENADEELTSENIHDFCETVIRWMVLGSPTRVTQHLAELYRHAMQDMEAGVVPESDHQMMMNGIVKARAAMEKVASIDHSLFRTAAKEFDAMLHGIE